ncbi:hypothetical protein IWX49DRAFT_409125 [Phyllosticta citricarpa]|uniref:Uncharacterized protein n=2 Tax=Phyllosticta TaxID=121621 RepID=A0ABR1MLP9_9PEZI
MQSPPIHQRWDENSDIRIGRSFNTKHLLRRKLDQTNHGPYISPAAPSVLPLRIDEDEQRRLFNPYPCGVCSRDCSAYSAECAESSSTMPAVPPRDTFSLSDACPELGGAHGYVELLKHTKISLQFWPFFARALGKAGINPFLLTTRDRLVAYVLWEAMMSPDLPGLGFAPGVSRAGGTLLFLDMTDPMRAPIEVHFFEFVRKLLEKFAEAERWHHRQMALQAAVQRWEQWEWENRSTGQESNAQEEEEEGKGRKKQEDDTISFSWITTECSSGATDNSSESSEEEIDYGDYLPPRDPIVLRAKWCALSGLWDMGNPYRNPKYRVFLNNEWHVAVPHLAKLEEEYAMRRAWVAEMKRRHDMALAAVKLDKEKGKGRLIEVESEDEQYDGEEESDSSGSIIGSRSSGWDSIKSWSNAIRNLFSNEEESSLEDADAALKKREGVVRRFWNSLDNLCGTKDEMDEKDE